MSCSKKVDNSHEMYNWLHTGESWVKDFPSLGDGKKKLSSLTPGKLIRFYFSTQIQLYDGVYEERKNTRIIQNISSCFCHCQQM